jgi:hypothetical protein
MSLRIKICRDVGGSWSVHGPSPVPVSDLPSLSASIDYARQACNAAPATIELYVDGMYIVAHQERGWPKALVASGIGRSRAVPAGPDPGRAALWSRLVAWLRRPRHLSTAAGPASLSKHEVSNAASLRLGVYGGMNENFVLVAGRSRWQADGV